MKVAALKYSQNTLSPWLCKTMTMWQSHDQINKSLYNHVLCCLWGKKDNTVLLYWCPQGEILSTWRSECRLKKSNHVAGGDWVSCLGTLQQRSSMPTLGHECMFSGWRTISVVRDFPWIWMGDKHRITSGISAILIWEHSHIPNPDLFFIV